MTRVRWLLAAAAADITAGGWLISVTWRTSLLHGWFCAVATASTVGCDLVPADTSGRIAQVAVMLTAIPLLATVFGQLHLDKVDARVEARLGQHHQSIHQRLDVIQQAQYPQKRRAPAGDTAVKTTGAATRDTTPPKAK